MKKALVTAILLSFVVGSQAFAEDDYTYSGALLNSLNKRIDNVAAPVVNKEKELNARQKALQDAQNQQAIARKQKLYAQQQAQQELVNKKKRQVQAQKEMFNQQKNELKNLFTVN